MNLFGKAFLTGREASRKAARMPFASSSSLSGLFLPRTQRNYAREVGDGFGNSMIVSAVNWISRNFPEAPLVALERDKQGEWAEIPDHPLTRLVEHPNAFYSGILLWMATLADWTVNGNAYWIKIRGKGTGAPVQLWWAPSHMVEPIASETEFISGYRYLPSSTQEIVYDVSEVIHFRNGMDPRNIRKGMSPLQSLLREIFTDDEAANFSASLLSNLGIPGVIIAPSPRAGEDYTGGVGIETDAEAIKRSFMDKFTGDRRGEPMVLTTPIEVQTLSLDPQKMDLKMLRRLPEERVAAVLGIPAVVLGLGAGLERATFANYAEAREAAYENYIIPTQRLLSSELTTQLLSDFEPADLNGFVEGVKVAFDITNVRALQQDQVQLVNAARTGILAGIQTVNEARAQVGLPSIGTKGDVFIRFPTRIEQPINKTLLEMLPEYQPFMGASSGADPEGGAGGDSPFGGDGGGEEKPPAEAGEAEKSYAFKGSIKPEKFQQELADIRLEAEEEMIGGLVEFFNEQAGRVGTRLDDGLDEVAKLLPASEDVKLEKVFRAGLTGVTEPTEDFLAKVLAAGQKALKAEDAEPKYTQLDDLLDDIAQRVVQINDVTRERIKDAIKAGKEAGYSTYQIANGVPADGYTGIKQMVREIYKNRALTIARTELARAQNLTAVHRYAKADVEEVEIMDGDGCGWTLHEDGDKAHGTIRTLDALRDYPIAHPRCVRVPLPVIPER